MRIFTPEQKEALNFFIMLKQDCTDSTQLKNKLRVLSNSEHIDLAEAINIMRITICDYETVIR